MTVSYLWNCTRVDAYPVEDENPDVVYNVHWDLLGASNEDIMPNGQPYQASSVGTQMLDTSTITEFIPFEDLTNEIVTAWVITAMGPEEVEDEQKLKEMIKDVDIGDHVHEKYKSCARIVNAT